MSAFRVFALVVIASLSGWLAAHNAIVSDCDRLDAFFDGTRLHHCGPTILTEENN